MIHAAAQAQPASQLLIQRAQADPAGTQLVITGENFGTGAPVVTLEGSPLTLVSHTPTQIVANLPAGLQPGSYLLNVSRDNGNSTADTDAFSVPISAVLQLEPNTNYHVEIQIGNVRNPTPAHGLRIGYRDLGALLF